jgi:hypothetical protein
LAKKNRWRKNCGALTKILFIFTLHGAAQVLAKIAFFLCGLGSDEWTPTLAQEPAASGAWNSGNSLVCSELRVICVQSREKIKKI